METGWLWLVFFVLIVLAIVAAVADALSWSKFKIAHECKVTGEMSGSTGVGISGSGNLVTTYTPGKTGWTCNDGKVYWR